MPECCVCLDEKIPYNIPCKHNLCKECYDKLIQKICPLCRRPIPIEIKKHILSSCCETVTFIIFIIIFTIFEKELTPIINMVRLIIEIIHNFQ
jgi:hypothetical protein